MHCLLAQLSTAEQVELKGGIHKLRGKLLIYKYPVTKEFILRVTKDFILRVTKEFILRHQTIERT